MTRLSLALLLASALTVGQTPNHEVTAKVWDAFAIKPSGSSETYTITNDPRAVDAQASIQIDNMTFSQGDIVSDCPRLAPCSCGVSCCFGRMG